MRWAYLAGLILVGAMGLLWADGPTAGKPAPAVVNLGDFGPLTTPAQVRAAHEKALAHLRDKGGILVVPSSVLPQLSPGLQQGLIRTPPPPDETKRWKTAPGVTILAADGQHPTLRVPPLSGMRIERSLRLQDGDSLPHWGTHPVVAIDSQLTYGSISYLDWIQAPVKKGKDRRFYLATVRGLKPGQFLNIHGGPGYGGGVTRACVKSLGYDEARKQHYLVADTSIDHVAGAILHNKSNTGILHMTQTSNNDNQTYDVKVIRNQYAHGDTYVYYCDFNYMSNVHSAAGDENGNCYAAFIRSKEDNFRGIVESVDWKTSQLRFSPSSRNINTLGDSRPLINLNQKKAITQGKVLIVPAESYWETTDTGKCRFEGKSYPTTIGKNPVTGARELKMGGLMRGDKDCPWTPEVVGRFFALTTPSEKTPKGTLRWYQISAFRANADGTKEIEIQRFYWGAKSAGSPQLYRQDNYTVDNHLRPLEYVIAPGTYVNDVSRALPGGDRGGQRILGVAPHPDQGTAFDFEKGDAIEQAIGPDPFKPQAFRVWMWEDVPGTWPSAVFDIRNGGAASRYAVLKVDGGPASLEETQKRHEQKPAWDNMIVLGSAAGVGLNCKADFANAAILFQQPHREQPIKWHHGHEEGKPPKEATLTVSRTTGELDFQGNGVRTNGPITAATGLSGDKTPAKNLRGKNVPVKEKATRVHIEFDRPEADGDYAVFVEQSWLSLRKIVAKGPAGFTVEFETLAPAGAKLDWMIVR